MKNIKTTHYKLLPLQMPNQNLITQIECAIRRNDITTAQKLLSHTTHGTPLTNNRELLTHWLKMAIRRLCTNSKRDQYFPQRTELNIPHYEELFLFIQTVIEHGADPTEKMSFNRQKDYPINFILDATETIPALSNAFHKMPEDCWTKLSNESPLRQALKKADTEDLLRTLEEAINTLPNPGKTLHEDIDLTERTLADFITEVFGDEELENDNTIQRLLDRVEEVVSPYRKQLKKQTPSLTKSSPCSHPR